MNLPDQVLEAFAPGGELAHAIPHFLPRPGQTEMALAVAQGIENPGVLVVEAGTGVGKTYSYLVPVLLSGERALISTATKTLQDQLYHRDLPRLTKALGLTVHAALLKGRPSYLCLHRLELACANTGGLDLSGQRDLAAIQAWSGHTERGDLAELPGLDERSPALPLVTSTRENCLGSACPQYRPCHVNLARKEALAADVVVVNHHLFFADLAVRESGMAELLPSVRVGIFDEAHQLNETGVQFLGRQWSSSQVLDLARDALATGLSQARGWCDWPALSTQLGTAVRELRLCAPRAAARLSWRGAVPEQVDETAWQAAMQAAQTALQDLRSALERVQESSPDFTRLLERTLSMQEHLALFSGACAPDCVRWLELGAYWRLVESPLDIAPTVQARLLGATGASGKSWVFTSATLGDDERLSWFTEPCGLTHARVLRVQSPFDHQRQAALYVPRDWAQPGDARHSERVAQLVLQAARQLGGRTLVLTTTLRALQAISAHLQREIQTSDELTLLVQGTGAKSHLMARFRAANANGNPGCILVASASFWEGIDIPGDALQLVVIDKLPFSPPNDPLVQARAQRLEDQGRNAFNDYFVPEAAVALKQGVGRLIRRESDRGVLVIADARLRSKGYGRRLLRALPGMRELANEAALWEELQAITTATLTSTATTASTTDPLPA